MNEEGWRGFVELCSKISAPKDMDEAFALFFTLEEKAALASRYTIVKGLLEGKLTQREIAETHKVSIAQITRGSNALKIISPRLRQLLKKLICSD